MNKEQNSMNRLMKCAALVAGVTLASRAAQAASTDLIIGFNQYPSVTKDYVIDLGTSAGVGIGGSSVVDLSSSYSSSLFSSTFPGGATGVDVGVVGGAGGTSARVFATQLRSGGAGVATTPGSTAPVNIINATALAQTGVLPGSVINANNLTSGNTGATMGNSINTASPDFDANGTSWSAIIAPGTSQNLGAVMAGNLNFDPRVSIGGAAATTFLDLWEENRVGASVNSWHYDGYFTLNQSANTLTFTPAALVPEPGSYVLLAGGGLLAIWLRRRL
jgi:hypothetical protein